MPFIKSSTFKRYTFLTIFISLNREIISPYFYYAKKGLIYITITDPFSCQPSFYTKYTKSNTCALCDVCLVSFNKYAFFYYTRRCAH